MSPIQHWSLTNFCFFPQGPRGDSGDQGGPGFEGPEVSAPTCLHGLPRTRVIFNKSYVLIGYLSLSYLLRIAQSDPREKNFLPWNRFTYSETSEKPFLRSFGICISIFLQFLQHWNHKHASKKEDNEEIETTRIVLNSFWNLFVWTHLWFLIHGCSKIQIYNSF